MFSYHIIKLYHQCKQQDCTNRHIANAGIESCLRKLNHAIKKFHAKPKVFGHKFQAGLRIKCNEIKSSANLAIRSVSKMFVFLYILQRSSWVSKIVQNHALGLLQRKNLSYCTNRTEASTWAARTATIMRVSSLVNPVRGQVIFVCIIIITFFTYSTTQMQHPTHG